MSFKNLETHTEKVKAHESYPGQFKQAKQLWNSINLNKPIQNQVDSKLTFAMNSKKRK